MTAQYLEIKAANTDALLFYRMADFSAMFFADAVAAAPAPDLALLTRGKPAPPAPPLRGHGNGGLHFKFAWCWLQMKRQSFFGCELELGHFFGLFLNAAIASYSCQFPSSTRLRFRLSCTTRDL